jgi:hypothetical protein
LFNSHSKIKTAEKVFVMNGKVVVMSVVLIALAVVYVFKGIFRLAGVMMGRQAGA